MTASRNVKSLLVAIVLILGSLAAAPFLSTFLGRNAVPGVIPVHAVGPVLGIDCALGASQDPAPGIAFPTPITTKDSDGVLDTSCLWTGDFDGDPHTPFPTFDALVSDSPELATAGLGGGFIANVRYTSMVDTINGFDITLHYNSSILNFVQFDQTGLLFGGNVNCPTPSPCTLQLSQQVDRVNGVVRLAQAVEATSVGPGATNPALNVNAVTLFRMRFDVVGAGFSDLSFTKSIVTFAIGLNTGPEAHTDQNSSFSTQSIFQLTNGQTAGTFNDTWTFSPNPEVPFAPITFSAKTAACSYCTAPFTYNWDFSSFDSSGYVDKINATGQRVIITAPPQAINRVTLTVTDSMLHSITAVRRLPLVGATQGPAGSGTTGTPQNTAFGPFKSGYLGGASAECSGGTCTGTGSTGFSGTWTFCPGNAFAKTVCNNPKAGANTDPTSITGVSWLFAGLYTTVFSVTDSSPSQVGGPQTATQNFLVNVTGATPAYTVAVTSNTTSINAGTAVNVTAVVSYASTYPLQFKASLFSFDFSWGDGSPDSTASGTTIGFAVHTYAFGGSFVVRVTPQESSAAAVSNIQENGYSPAIVVFDYNLLATPNTQAVEPGGSTTTSLSASLTGGASQTVSFSASGQPTGSTVNFSPTSCSLSCSSQVSVTTAPGTPLQSATIMIKGTSTTGLVKTTAFTLKVVFNATISCPATGTVGVAVNCTATEIGGVGLTTFEWSAPNGAPSTGKGASFSTTFSVTGPQAITLTANDSATPTPNMVVRTATVTISQPQPFTVTINCPATGTVGTPVSCSASSTGGTGTVTFSWTATGATPSSGAGSTFSTTYNVKGSYSISVTGTDSATPTPHTQTKSANIMISPLALTVAATVPGTGVVGTSISVSATATGGTSPYTFTWDFGDGSAAVSGATASHTYTVKGTFNVRVTVTDHNAATTSTTASITISPLPLTTDFTFPATITAGTPVTFTATTSGGTSPYTYLWNFGDGTAAGTGNPVSHTYSSTGPFTVVVTVTDHNGQTATATHMVGQAALVVTMTCPTTGTVGTVVSCSASSTGGVGTVTFAWTATGGTPTSGTGTSFSTTYNVKGTFTISVTGTDSATPTPHTDTKSANIAINSLALVVTPTIPAIGTIGTSVSVSATATGGTTPYTFSWDFGDGTTAVAGATATHIYTVKGTFTVKVTVTDHNAATASNTASITISPLALTTDFSISPTTVTAGTPITFTATTTGGTTPYTFAWTFGDGTTGTGNPVQHTYSSTGPFTVSLTVTDHNSVTATASHTIGSAPPFVVTISCPSTGTVGTAVNCTASSTGGTGTVTFSWTATGGTPSSGTGTSFGTRYNVKGSYSISVTGTDSATPTPNTQTKTANIAISPLALAVTPTVPTIGTVGTSIGVSATATGGTSPYTFSWDFGDGSAAVVGATASHAYTAKGSFTVKVTVTDMNAVTASQTASITISPLGLTTDFTFPASVSLGNSASFTATTSGGTAPYTYSWNFGDGSAAGTSNPILHTYTALGTFNVVLTVTDHNGQTATANHNVVVTQGFTVTINCPATGTVGTAVGCTATSSFGTGTVTFFWTAIGGSPLSGTEASFSTTYNVKGTFMISVTGTDSATPTPHTDTKSANVMISPLAFAVSPTVPAMGTVGTSISVSATATGGTTPYTFSWDFGDGSATVTGAAASHTYTVKGTFTVKVTVTDMNAVTASNTASITISPLALSADFTFSPSAPTNATAVTFTATVTGGTAPYSYSWSFGDGSGSTTNPAMHTFAPGTFTVQLNVTDANGMRATVSHSITVTSSVTGQPILLTFQAKNIRNCVNGVSQLSVTVNNQPVVSLPPCGAPSPSMNAFITYGPFDITQLVVQGQNTLVFTNQLKGPATLIANVTVTQGNTLFFNFTGPMPVNLAHPLTFTFGNPPLKLTSINLTGIPLVDDQVVITATFTGGTGPVRCHFNFGNGEARTVRGVNGSCRATVDFDNPGHFVVTVRVTGPSRGDRQIARLTVEVRPSDD